ncbi:M56 family metallopeptidase [Lacinutrix chionoecetis]
MIHYILQTIVFQLLFLMVYDVFLRKETFFNWNRFYLLASALFSVVLPFVKINSFKEVIPQKFIVTLPEVIIGAPEMVITPTQDGTLLETGSSFVFNWHYIIYIGCAVALILFVVKLFKLLKLASKHSKVNFINYVLVNLIGSSAAFSFFNYVFIGDQITNKDRQIILHHELEHVKAKHSIDLLFFEVLRILFWFNPLIYLYQNRMVNLHEFVADSKAVKSSGKTNYYKNLLSQVFDTEKVSFINPFFKQSLIKKRIIMLSKSKSKQIHLAKYLLVIPMVVGMLFYTSCTAYQENETASKIDLKEYTYTINLDSDNSDATIAKQKKVSDFLHNNKEYVSWIVVDYRKGVSTITVHHESETPPSDYEDLSTDISNEIKYKAFRKFINKEALNSKKEEKEVTFQSINQVPSYPGCDTTASKDAQRECFSQNINKLVAKNFDVNLGKSLGLVGMQKIIANFIINKAGNIDDIKVRASHIELENEVRRVIRLIPQLKPGEHDGKPVNVSFTLPIQFNIVK